VLRNAPEDVLAVTVNEPSLARKSVAEAIGTFALVFAGTGAIVINESSHGVISHVGIALTFGLIVLVMIYTLGDISGAHINPAVTIGFWFSRRLPAREVLPYLASQCAGALIASGIMRLLFPENRLLGSTQPFGPVVQSFVLEFLLTALLMFVILGVSTGAREKGITAGIAVGAVIALEAMFAGPITGASMNPARSLGPALISGHLANLWLYLAAPVLGAGVGVLGCRCVRDPGCCTTAKAAKS
jgi:aquaporin Z